jgi:hypothetical protein
MAEGGGDGIVPKRISAHALIQTNTNNIMGIKVDFNGMRFLFISYLLIRERLLTYQS